MGTFPLAPQEGEIGSGSGRGPTRAHRYVRRTLLSSQNRAAEGSFAVPHPLQVANVGLPDVSKRVEGRLVVLEQC